MAGRGTRTQNEYSVPKPLIFTKDRPLFSWALQGLPLEIASDLTFVTNKSVGNNPIFLHYLETYVPKNLKARTLIIDNETSGQAETVLLGLGKVPKSNGLLIFNCDTFISDNFPRIYSQWDGILGSYPSTDPSMSYIEVDSMQVLRTAEKAVISPLASTGLYFFKNKDLFLEAYEKTPHTAETYVAPMYNYLIEQGLAITYFETQKFVPLGTPQEITSFEFESK